VGTYYCNPSTLEGENQKLKAIVCLKKKKKGRKEGKNEGGRVGEKSREERLGEWLKR
jgi:hypothetical protein